MDKDQLFQLGKAHITHWCSLNSIPVPRITSHVGRCPVNVCAYYRSGHIHIWLKRCTALGKSGASWSWPGYSVDRTPYGVLAHELGHHVDLGTVRWVEPPVTSYAENEQEWFAEMFRVFVTNPSLLSEMRPRTYCDLISIWPNLAENRHWKEVLSSSDRHLQAAARKVFRED